MNDSPTPRAEPQKSAPRSQGVYDTTEPSRDSPKKIGVYERPERASGWRSPALTIALVIAALLALLFILRILLGA